MIRSLPTGNATMMRRAHIRLDEATYMLARQRASAEGISFAAFVRKAVEQQLAPEHLKQSRLDDFTFIGSGRSKPSDPRPLSERHDEALAEDVLA